MVPGLLTIKSSAAWKDTDFRYFHHADEAACWVRWKQPGAADSDADDHDRTVLLVRRAIWFGNDPYITGTGPDVHTRMSKQMSVDRFEYPDLALTVERGKVGYPSTVTLDWVTVDQDGQEHDRKLVLGCELLIDKVERCRELTIVSVSGDADAVADFNAYLPSDIDYQHERMADVADGMGRAILHASIKHEYPELVVVRRCA